MTAMAIDGSATTGGGWMPQATFATDPIVAAWSRGKGAPSRDALLMASRAKISRLLRLETGWDGSNGRPPEIVAAMVLNGILELVTPVGSPTPQIAPLADGGIQVEWLVNGNSVEINVDRAGSVSVLGFDALDNEVFDAEHNYYEPSLVELLDRIRAHLEGLGHEVQVRASVS